MTAAPSTKRLCEHDHCTAVRSTRRNELLLYALPIINPFPEMPIWERTHMGMIAFSVGCALALTGYGALLSLLSR